MLGPATIIPFHSFHSISRSIDSGYATGKYHLGKQGIPSMSLGIPTWEKRYSRHVTRNTTLGNKVFPACHKEYHLGKQCVPSMSLENTTLGNNMIPACHWDYHIGKQCIPSTSLENTTLGNKVFPACHHVGKQCIPSTSLENTTMGNGRLYSVEWTRDWTVGLDSQKVALIILKHQNTTKYLHDMNGIRGSRP